MAQDLKALKRLLLKAMVAIPDDVPRIVQVEGLAFIKKNFKGQGFNTGAGAEAWKKKQTEDRSGRDITRYRTNRRGRAGSLNKYGRRIANRAILVGHKTGGNKLKNSFRARRNRKQVWFSTHKEYAQRHNEGLKGMPQRRFMGPSSYLDKRIENKLTRTLDKRFKKK